MKDRIVASISQLTKLFTAVFLGISTPVLAQMSLSDDGTGDVLIFPFYTVVDHYTDFEIHNAADHSKALGLRVREGLGGNEVLNFYIYLPPGETFEGRMVNGSEGAEIGGKNGVCTVPKLTHSQAGDYAFQPLFSFTYANDSNRDASRTLSGTIEVIELGQWPSDSIGGWKAENISDCNWLVEAWSGDDGVWVEDSTRHALPWTPGGISGKAVIRSNDQFFFGAESRNLGDIEVPPFVLQGFAREGTKAEYHNLYNSTGSGVWPADNLGNGTNQFTAPRFGNEIMEAESGLQAVSALLSLTGAKVIAQDKGSPETSTILVSFPTKFLHSREGATNPTAPFTTLWNPEESAACEAVLLVNSSDDPDAGQELELCATTHVIDAGNSPFAAVDKVETGAIRDRPYSLRFDYEADAVSSSGRTIYVYDTSGKAYPVTGMPVYVLPIVAYGASESTLKWAKDPVELVSPLLDDGVAASSGEASAATEDGSFIDIDGGSVGGAEAAGGNFSKLLLEVPADGGTYTGIGQIQGWALDGRGQLGSQIDFYIDGVYQGQIGHGDTRLDVGGAFPSVRNSNLAGFSAAFNFNELSPGWHEIDILSAASDGTALRSSARFRVVKFGSDSFLSGDNAPRIETCVNQANDDAICNAVVGENRLRVTLRWSAASQGFEVVDVD